MNAEIFQDQIGEDTALSDCGLCHAVSCFSCVDERCVALEKFAVINDDGNAADCAFYKDSGENRKQILKCFFRLIRQERFDLLKKYAATMVSLGLMDREMESAAQQQKALEQFRSKNLESLYADNWKDTLVVISLTDDYADAGNSDEMNSPDETEDSGAQHESLPIEPDDSFDFSLYNEVLADPAPHKIGNESAGNVDIYKYSISEDELSMDYAEDFTDESCALSDEDVDYDEDADSSEDADSVDADSVELAKEAEQEKAVINAEAERANIDDGTEIYQAAPLDSFYKKYGFPVKTPKLPDPVDLAYQNLGAAIIYKAAEDYVTVLRMLWSGDYDRETQYQLVVAKWELETLMGSDWYWQFTNINPDRILDRCWVRAKEQSREKIKRINRRIAAGIEDIEDR